MKYYILFLLFAFSFFNTFAQPANDACAGAAAINPNNGCVSGTTVAAADNWIGSVGCQGGGTNEDVWYTFTAINNQLTYNVTTSGAWVGNAEFILVEATGACAGLGVVGSNCGPSVLSGTVNGLQIGTLYYITISTPSAGTPGDFTLCINNIAAPVVAGQDCTSAAILCNSDPFTQSTSSGGFGVQEINPANSCWGSGGERQSKWFKFTVGCTGTLEFNINPAVSGDDYDWALYNTTTAGCPTTASSTPSELACNWSGCKGSTGITTCVDAIGEPGRVASGAGCGGNPAAWNVQTLNVTAGNTYALLVDNFSTSNSGFTLTFGGACGGGTAILGPTSDFTYTNPSCGAFNFTKTCQTTNSTFLWTFGDGGTSTLQNPSYTYVTTGVYTIVLQVTDALGCVSTSSASININFPVASATPNPSTICSSATTNIALSSTVLGTTYSWIATDNINVTGESLTAQTSTTIANTLVNLTSVPQNVTYTVTPTAAGCTGPNLIVTVIVNPQNTITPGSNQTVCVNTALTNITMNTTVATGATFSGLPAGVTGSWAGNVATISGTPTASGTFNYTVTTTGGCPPASTTGTITVTPLNTIAPGTNQTVCINSAITTINLATTSATGATFSGLPAGVTGSWAGNVATISGTPTAAGTFNYTVTTTGGCPPANTTGTITVTPLNTIAAGTSQTVCINSAITTINLATTGATGATFSGLPAGVSGSWAANIATITGTPTASGTFNYTVTTTGGCPPATANGTLTVTPLNTIAAGTSQTVCVNSAITTINLATTGATGATFSGLPAGVTGSWAANVATISGTPTTAGTFNYTVTTTGGCPPATATGTITVTPLNTIAAGTSQTVCINSPISNITLTTTGATGATFSGLPAGVIGSWAGNVATISGTPTASGTFNYTVTTTGGCPPATANGTITVTPLNTITLGTSQTVCINSAITTINLATTGATGATFSGLPTGVTGSWAGNVATISGTPTASGTFNYTVTTTGGCPPATATGTITVTPLNTIAAGTSQTVCINSAITAINLATTGATGATFSGLPAGVTGSWAANVATISGTPTASGTFNYTVTTTGGCPPATATGTITVTPINTIAAGTSQTVCINTAISTINLATTGATGATFSGLPAGVTGSWAANVATITGTPTASGTFNYTVTTTGGCPPASTTGTITVTPLNTIAPGTSQTVCVNSAITTINLATTGATGATFSGLPAGVTGSWAANVATISGTPTAAGTFNYTVTTTGGCPPATATGTITVTPLNTIAPGTSETVCVNSPITTINLATIGATGATFSGLPAGVSGSWAGNTATIFGTPTAVGTFNYTVTTTGGCPPATANGTITVVAIPVITLTPTDPTVCNGTDGSISVSGSGTGTIFWSGAASGSQAVAAFPSIITNLGSGGYNVYFVNATGCQSLTVSTSLNNPGAPIIDPISDVDNCGTSYTLNIITGTSLVDPQYYTLSGGPSGGGVIVPVGTMFSAPTDTILYAYDENGVCNSEQSFTIVINALPTVTSVNGGAVYCAGDPVSPITASVTGTPNWTLSYTLDGVAQAPIVSATSPISLGTAAGTYAVTNISDANCSNSASGSQTITITPLNTIAPGTSQTVCMNSAITTINLATTGATGATFSGLPAGVTGSWAANVATISGTPTASGTFNYTVTTTGGCPPANTTGTITITPLNTIAAGTSQTVCINSAITTINLATTGATGATFSGLPAGVTGSWAANVATITGTPTASGTFNYTVTTTGGCPPAIATGTITVTPLNTIAAGTSQTVCINSAITTINLVTTGATGATFSGLPAGVTGSWAANVATITGTPTASGTFNYTVTTTGGCPPATATGTITVTPINTITLGTSETVCINSAITDINLTTTGATGATFAGLPAGVTGSWAGNVATISGTPTASGTFNYTVTTTGGCPPATANGTITVTPLNTIAPGTSQTACINSAIATINLATTGATGATFSGLPAGVTGSWAANVATISGTPTASGTFNYTVTTTGGCLPANTTGTITVTPLNTIAAGTSQTVCMNSTITDITLTTTGATGATFAGLPAGVSGSWAGNVATISGTPTASGTFNYTVTTTGGCPPATANGTITVTPLNTVAAGTSQTVCINSSIATINLVTTGAMGATFSGLPAGVSGSWAGNVATISGTPTASGTFNYTVTTTGGCPPATTTGTITVTPLNTIAPGTSETVCINSAITTINLATTGATGATFSGLPAGVTGSWAANAATISGTPTAAGTFNYTVTTTGGCMPASTTGTITVTPSNTITPGTSETVCMNSAITDITLTTTGATGAIFSGLPAGVTGSWAANVATISGTPTASGTFNYTVTTTGGCPPATANGTITVTPLNTIAAGTSQTVCINSPITTINLATTGATGATFAGLPAGVTGSWTGNVATISGTPTASGTFNYTVTTTGGCPPATATGTIIVDPLPTFTLAGTDPTVCNATDGFITISGLSNNTAYDVSYNAVASANYTSSATGTITISGLGAGGYNNFVVTLTLSGCTGNSATTITLNNPGAPIIDDLADVTVCDSYGLPVITGTNLSGNENYYNNSQALGGVVITGPITLSQTVWMYDINGSCFDEESFVVTVNNTPSITNPGNQTVCATYTLPTIVGANLSGNEAYYNNSQALGGSVTSSPITSTQTVWIYDAEGTCSDEESFLVTINPLPTVTAVNGGATYCAGDVVNPIQVGVTGSANWTIDYTLNGVAQTANGASSPISLGNAAGTYVVTNITDANCTNTASGSQTITVNPIPAAPIAGTDTTYCSNWTPVAMTATGTGGTITWYTDAALTSVTTSTPSNTLGTTVYYVTETVATCEGPASAVTITIENCDIIIPTAFTPDNDGVNDVWEIVDLDAVYSDNVVMVFNRWGNKLYESEKGAYASRPWDGTFEGEALPVGSYYFIIDFNDEDVEPSKGVVSIILNK